MEKNNKRVHWSASNQKTIEHKVFTREKEKRAKGQANYLNYLCEYGS
jgi:predicted transposase YbfD/YdcC